MSNPVFVALDTPDLEQAITIAKSVRGHVGGLKLGLEFFCAHGHHGVHEIQKLDLPIFLDLKLHAINMLEPAVVTVHASGGRAMMEDAKAAANEHTKVVGVTLLTSLDQNDMGKIGYQGTPHDQVERLADLAREAGLDGIVCSGNEVGAAHKIWKDGFFVVPGLRPKGGAMGDQKRAVTPQQARNNGASLLVIGRPITGAENPNAAARAIEATL